MDHIALIEIGVGLLFQAIALIYGIGKIIERLGGLDRWVVVNQDVRKDGMAASEWIIVNQDVRQDLAVAMSDILNLKQRVDELSQRVDRNH